MLSISLYIPDYSRMGLKIVIEDAARRALKNHEPETLTTLRMFLSSVKNREIEKRAKGGEPDLSEDEVTAVLRSEVKKRRDAIAEFQKGNRQDLADKEAREMAILEKYLPAEIGDEEIEKLLVPLVAQGATVKDFGRVMSAAMKAVSGRASGERVSAIVRKLIGAR